MDIGIGKVYLGKVSLKKKKNGVGLRPSTYLGCRKPTPFFFFFLMKPSLRKNQVFSLAFIFWSISSDTLVPWSPWSPGAQAAYLS